MYANVSVQNTILLSSFASELIVLLNGSCYLFDVSLRSWNRREPPTTGLCCSQRFWLVETCSMCFSCVCLVWGMSL